ncbi:Hypothetical predicted protein, partial [Marmota monax]
IQEWLCLNCQTQRAISGQLGDMGKTPSIPAGSKASPVPVLAEPPSQKTAVPAQVKVKKKEPEVKVEAEKLIPEKVKEIPSIEKILPKGTTDQKQEESKLKKDVVSTLQEKKLPSKEEKPLSEEKVLIPEEKQPTSEDNKLPPEAKSLVVEEKDKHEVLKAEGQTAEETHESRVSPEAVQEEKQPQAQMEDLPPGTQSLPKEEVKITAKMKEQPQAAGITKSDQVEPGKEKT